MEILTVVRYMENPELTKQKNTIEFQKKLNKALTLILTDDIYNLFSPATHNIEKLSDSTITASQINVKNEETENKDQETNGIDQQKLEVEGYPLCKFLKEGRIDATSEWFKLGEIVSRDIPKNSERERYVFIELVEDKDLIDTNQTGISR